MIYKAVKNLLGFKPLRPLFAASFLKRETVKKNDCLMAAVSIMFTEHISVVEDDLGRKLQDYLNAQEKAKAKADGRSFIRTASQRKTHADLSNRVPVAFTYWYLKARGLTSRNVRWMSCSFDDLVNYGVVEVLGTYMLEYNGHMSIVVDGTFYDVFDERQLKVKKIWSVA